MQPSQVAQRNRQIYETTEVIRYYTGAIEEIGLLEEERAILNCFG